MLITSMDRITLSNGRVKPSGLKVEVLAEISFIASVYPVKAFRNIPG